MKKRYWIFLIILSLLLVGCGKENSRGGKKEEGFLLYYLDISKSEALTEPYELKSNRTEDMVNECIKALQTSPDKTKYCSPFLSGVVLLKCQVDNRQVNLFFNESYGNLPTTHEVLIRSAIVRTLVQIPGVDCVSFYVDEAPLRDAKGNAVGIMTADTFVENIGQQINTIEEKSITLYYATQDGEALVAEEVSVYTSTNVSAEKLVVEHLIEGPSNAKYLRTIPAGTKLINVSTLNGVCIVNFDETFLSYDYQVSDEVALYSIVNSLCEIGGVNKVQISVSGNTNIKFRDKYSLEELYERRLDYVEKEEE